MGLRSAMETLARDWTEIRGHLSSGEADQLSELVEEFVREGDPDVSAEIAEEIVILLRARLPIEHALRQALLGEERRGPHDRDRELVEWVRLGDPLRARLGRPGPGTNEIRRAVAAELLSAESYTEPQVRERGVDPGDLDVIRLDREDGTPQWPAFQFGADGTPPPVVRTINRILAAHDDPYGAADWWLSENAWLRIVPAHAIGRVPDDRLIAAARAAEAEA
jgi:hypothetical protein